MNEWADLAANPGLILARAVKHSNEDLYAESTQDVKASSYFKKTKVAQVVKTDSSNVKVPSLDFQSRNAVVQDSKQVTTDSSNIQVPSLGLDQGLSPQQARILDDHEGLSPQQVIILEGLSREHIAENIPVVEGLSPEKQEKVMRAQGAIEQYKSVDRNDESYKEVQQDAKEARALLRKNMLIV